MFDTYSFSPTEKPAKENPGPTESRDDGVPPPAGGRPPQAAAVQTCLAELSMEIEGDFSACRHVGRHEYGGAAHCNDHVADEGRHPELEMPRTDEDSTDFSDRDHCFDEDLQAAVDFFRRPPPLLSPVPSPPLVSLPPLSTLPSSLAPVSLYLAFEFSCGRAAPAGTLAMFRECCSVIFKPDMLGADARIDEGMPALFTRTWSP